MSSHALQEISFGMYFALLRLLLPHGLDFYICGISGTVLAADAGNQSRVPRMSVRIDKTAGRVSTAGRSCLTVDKCSDSFTYMIDIHSPADEVEGLLVAVGVPGSELRADGLDDAVCAAFEVVVEFIEKEFRFTMELNAMAQELAGRYEELNLVYDTSDEDAGIEDEDVMLRKLLGNYVEYLDVDMVALFYPQQDRILSATGNRELVHEPNEIIRQLSRDYLPQARSDGGCLLINDITDRRRDRYPLEMPYKILSCPVFNARGEIGGVLICLNHIYRSDFFNSDRSLLKVMAKKIAKIMQTNYDALTGLLNQHSFETILQRALDQTHNDGMYHCLLNIDINRLQVLNESVGREAGDRVIRHIGELLRQKLRGSDSVCYLGEGHFGVLLDRCGIEQGIKVSQALLDWVRDSGMNWGTTSLDLSISIGITVLEPHTRTIEQVLEAAELARDAAKELGDGQLQVFRQDDQDLVARKNQMQCVSHIQKALRENRFSLYCQTIRPVAENGEEYHFEVLLRLLDEDGGVLGPDKFIPSAEQFNLMPTIDRWVIDATFSTLAAAGIAGIPGQGQVSINLSGQSLAGMNLVEFVKEKLHRYKIAPECICFEVTETVAIGNRDAALSIIRQLKSLGCKFSLDDFGTGMSSFSYLKELPVDYVKIDGSFVKRILEDKVSHAMVASINQIGHVMGLQTIAEFVENDALAKRLALMGVDYLQGYGIAKPQLLTDYLSGLYDAHPAQAG